MPLGLPEISPDGRHVVFERAAAGGLSNLWTIDLVTGATRQLGVGPATSPMWSPDSSRVLFQSVRGVGGNANLYQLSVDDPTRVTPVVEAMAALSPAGWLPGGDGVVFRSFDPGNQSEIPGGLYIKRDAAVVPFRVGINANETRVSPDGSHIAWANSEVEQDVFLDAFPIPRARPVQVSRNGGLRPRWRRVPARSTTPARGSPARARTCAPPAPDRPRADRN